MDDGRPEEDVSQKLRSLGGVKAPNVLISGVVVNWDLDDISYDFVPDFNVPSITSRSVNVNSYASLYYFCLLSLIL